MVSCGRILEMTLWDGIQLVDAQGAHVSVLTDLQMAVQLTELRSHPLFKKKITIGARTLVQP